MSAALLVTGGQALGDSNIGADVELICPCTFESASSSSVVAGFGVINRTPSTSGELRLEIYAHTEENYRDASTPQRVGDLLLTTGLAGSNSITSSEVQVSLRSPTPGDYYVTLVLLEDMTTVDQSRTDGLVTFAGDLATTSANTGLYFVGDPSISVAGTTLTLDLPGLGNSGTVDYSVPVQVIATDTPRLEGVYQVVATYPDLIELESKQKSAADNVGLEFTDPGAGFPFYHVLVPDEEFDHLVHTVQSSETFNTLSFTETNIDYLTDSDGDGVADANERLMGTNESSAASKPGDSVIDVLTVFNASVASDNGGDPTARIDQLFTVANQALTNSNTGMQVRVVGYEQLGFSDAASPSTLLTQANNGAGVFSNLQQLRTNVGADLVVIFQAKTAVGDCEAASQGGYPTQGHMARKDHISVSVIDPEDCDDLTMIHGIGHNMGLRHSFEQNESGTFLWSRGHGAGRSFATVMTYAADFDLFERVPYFSNPTVNLCDGQPCGVAVGSPQAANAAASLQAVRFQVARFSPTVVVPGSPPPPTGSGSGGGGSPGAEEPLPSDPNESVDTDGDGTDDNADRDDDNDGMPDRYEVFAGHDPLVDDADEVGNNNGMTNLEVYLALPKSNQYLQNTTASPNIARLHIVNTSENAQRFTGTIFDKSGDRLGDAYQSLGPEVPPKGRLILDSSDFESLFSIESWKGPAMVEVLGTDSFSLMSKLVSRSGLISNTNCVSENRVLNIERYNPDNVTYVRLINTTENTMGSIKGTLYDSSGNVVGSADTELVSSLLPKEMVWINIRQFEQLFGQQWDGEAMLEVTETEGLKLLNLNLINGETFFNFSCLERGSESEPGRVYLQTSTTGPNLSMTHIVNTGQTSQQFTATMYNKEGEQLGAANQVLGNAASRGRVIVSTADLEEIFGVSPWKGPSMLEISGSASFELMTKQTSRSGLVSNVNCVRQNQVHNIEGMDSSAVTYIRFINTSDTAINNVTGTLYDSNGNRVGPPGQTLLATIASKEQVFINRNNLIDIFDGAWNGEVMLEVESDDALRLLNLNFINSETFFNFSCYEASN